MYNNKAENLKYENKDTPGLGCGVWKIMLKHTRWQDACIWHDKAYTEDSYQQAFISRKAVDSYFLFQMLEINKDLPHKTLYNTIAKSFYYISRILGWVWWEGKK